MMIRPCHSDDSAILFGFGHTDSDSAKEIQQAIPFGLGQIEFERFDHPILMIRPPCSDSAMMIRPPYLDSAKVIRPCPWGAMKIAAVAFHPGYVKSAHLHPESRQSRDLFQ